MDGDRFDALTRRFTTATSRRGVVKIIGGGLVAGLIGAVGRARADAATCRGLGVLCLNDAHCCTGACDGRDHRCICPTGQTACGGKCVSTATDVSNCGGCGNHCSAPANASPICDGGQCGFTCAGGFKPCNGTCIPSNACCDDSACGGGQTCQSGTCTCPGGKLNCGGVCQQCCSADDCPAATCSTATCTDGVCGLTRKAGCCSDDSECSDGNDCTVDTCDKATGQCVHTAAPSGTACGIRGVCTGTFCCIPNDIASCTGRCGTVTGNCGQSVNCGGCPAGYTCSNGACVANSGGGGGGTCPSGKVCNGICCASASDVCTGGGCCTPKSKTAACGNRQCGNVLDGCGKTVNCGQCTDPWFPECKSNGFCGPMLGGCFAGGTRIAMADDTSRPIEDVRVGDRVLGRNGINRVLGVDRPYLGHRPLYAFNGGAPFVTAGHPFLTRSGWKAVEPGETQVPGLRLGRLTVGDRVHALAGLRATVATGGVGDKLAPRVEPVPLTRLTAHAAAPDTPLFHLNVDGDHTYLANGFVVNRKRL